MYLIFYYCSVLDFKIERKTMKKRYLLLILLSLFLIISTASADDIISDDSGVVIEDDSDLVIDDNEGESVDNSDITDPNEGDSSDSSSGADNSGTTPVVSNSSNNGAAVQFNKTPYKFSSTKNIASTYGKKVKFSVKVLNKDGKAINHTLVTFKANGKIFTVEKNEVKNKQELFLSPVSPQPCKP